MKKYKKLFVSLLAAAVLTVGSAFSVMAADTYTYKVTVYAGNKGTIDGQEQKEITGLSLGSQVILDINSVKVTDDKYYVKGFRLSGRDNEEALATPTIEVDGDVDYVIAYGIKGDMVAYTVNYQDANGKTLADSQTFYGNAGDKPVVAYKYIENYIPQALALTKTLSDNESENVFTFTYTPGETDRIVETTTTVTTIVPGPTTTTTTTGTTGTGTTGTGTTGTGTTGTTGTGTTGTTGTGTGTAANGTNAANNAAGDNTANGANTNAGGTTDNQNNGQDADNQDNQTTDIPDNQVPETLVDLDDEETPKSNIDAEDGSNTLPMVGGAAVGILSVAALAALFVYLKKRSR